MAEGGKGAMPPTPDIAAFRWVGSKEPLLDTPTVATCGRVVIGRYGGHTGAGARYNEDGALAWCAADGGWEFALLLDAHYSAESAELVLAAMESERDAVAGLLGQGIGSALPGLQRHVLDLFGSPAIRAACRRVEGEASCLICARKGNVLWWLAIGDCMAYHFHPWLAQFGGFALNARSFYEWVGHRNTFDLPVPCFTSGTRRLLEGENTILLLTDGLLECGSRPFEDPRRLYNVFALAGPSEAGLEQAARQALLRVERERGRDSATLLTWRVAVHDPVPGRPS
jgi:hypothetical protein